MTSLHGPLDTDLGKDRRQIGQLGQHLELARAGLRAFCISSNSEMRPAISSTDDTSSAISIRRMLANALISTGMSEPFGFSNSSAGPPDLTLRSANSVISRTRVDFEGDALELAALFQGADKLAQVVISHVPYYGRLHDEHDKQNSFGYRSQPRDRRACRPGFGDAGARVILAARDAKKLEEAAMRNSSRHVRCDRPRFARIHQGCIRQGGQGRHPGE